MNGLAIWVMVGLSVVGADPPAKRTDAENQAHLKRLYPELPKLPQAPTPLPGPKDCPLTLDDLQRLAAENSPALAEAKHNVTVALGNWLMAAGAQMDLENARLALKRARSDLSTDVRKVYFALLVSRETVRVNKELAEFTDSMYQVSATLLREGKSIAPYEPAALRAQCFVVRLAYQQAIQGYLYNWKQLVSAIGLPRMPLTEVAGGLDSCIPFYDYNAILDHVLKHHTDVKTACNALQRLAVEGALTNSLADNYATYKTNLQALETYRTCILPEMVRVYRGVRKRYNSDETGVTFADLVTAQQTLAGGLMHYLTTLGAFWSSAVSVADLLQTDDLFQLAHPVDVAPIPELLDLPYEVQAVKERKSPGLAGHTLDQTIWNWMFEPGTARLTAGGQSKLEEFTRRKPRPDPLIFLQTAQDIAYDPIAPDKMVETRDELDAKRIQAIQKFLEDRPADGCKWKIEVRDPAGSDGKPPKNSDGYHYAIPSGLEFRY